MGNAVFIRLRAEICTEQSFSRLGRFWSDNLLFVAGLTDSQRAHLRAVWIERRNFLADRLAERAAA